MRTIRWKDSLPAMRASYLLRPTSFPLSGTKIWSNRCLVLNRCVTNKTVSSPASTSMASGTRLHNHTNSFISLHCCPSGVSVSVSLTVWQAVRAGDGLAPSKFVSTRKEGQLVRGNDRADRSARSFWPQTVQALDWYFGPSPCRAKAA